MNLSITYVRELIVLRKYVIIYIYLKALFLVNFIDKNNSWYIVFIPFQYLEAQAEYHRKALSFIEESLPKMRMAIGE